MRCVCVFVGTPYPYPYNTFAYGLELKHTTTNINTLAFLEEQQNGIFYNFDLATLNSNTHRHQMGYMDSFSFLFIQNYSIFTAI